MTFITCAKHLCAWKEGRVENYAGVRNLLWALLFSIFLHVQNSTVYDGFASEEIKKEKIQGKRTGRMKKFRKGKRESENKIKIQWHRELKYCIIQRVLEYSCWKIIIQAIAEQYSCLVCIVPWGIHLDSDIAISIWVLYWSYGTYIFNFQSHFS